ncbi:aminotransferase class V-fold PLP-dependent enzyme [Rickettsiales bacterium]|nr:aminotransferase class V-fold PLP-dependent enzyme [Rickettsiales bacterium]
MYNIHFNNAGSSLSKKIVLSKVNNYLLLEKKIGGYEAQDLKHKLLDKFYTNVSNLINADESEISFLSNSTLAWNLVFNSIHLSPEDNIIIFENEYSSNYISILKRRKLFNKLLIIKINKKGLINLDELEKKVDSNTKVLSVNHIASQSGNVFPIKKIGKILKSKNKNAIYIVDGCQSAGQVKIDVKNINCDFFTASGRKYLRGPRGTGFLYIKKNIKNKINPVFLDLSSSSVNKKNKITIDPSSKFMENFEHSPALKLGLSTAIEETLNIGIDKINKKIVELSKYFRNKISSNKNCILMEDKSTLSGINTMYFMNHDVKKVFKYLNKFGIRTYVSNEKTSFLYFRKIKKKNILRVSFHHFNTKKEINCMVKALNDLK